jgi:hypothetical protein
MQIRRQSVAQDLIPMKHLTDLQVLCNYFKAGHCAKGAILPTLILPPVTDVGDPRGQMQVLA